MRNAFAAAITELAAADERVAVLSGDIGNRLFDDFKERHPRGSITAEWPKGT